MKIFDKYDSNKYIEVQPGIIIAKGGDGTLLRAINKYRKLNLPFFGIAAGTENFLMNPSEYLADNAKYKTFKLIKVKVTYEKLICGIDVHELQEVTEEFQAFNEIMIGGDMNSYIYFDVHDNDKIIGKFKGGGVIFSTAAGSTGVNKNNHSGILPLSSNNWIVTGDKTNRNINYVIEPKRTTITFESRTPVILWVDGPNHIIQNVKKAEVSQGDEVTVIFNDYDEFKKKRRI